MLFSRFDAAESEWDMLERGNKRHSPKMDNGALNTNNAVKSYTCRNAKANLNRNPRREHRVVCHGALGARKPCRASTTITQRRQERGVLLKGRRSGVVNGDLLLCAAATGRSAGEFPSASGKRGSPSIAKRLSVDCMASFGCKVFAKAVWHNGEPANAQIGVFLQPHATAHLWRAADDEMIGMHG